ncbi:AsmA family protein [Thalassobaculum sp. OXR-137]|uniref:AsmA family protein n=1 Tax=Thalassobaculum sp. OXR-137 TaxID=3100173 RepID=UPI002AC89C2D|nr:AsmA family protein [Thalassobaculum sp. OXR-137]WPZ34394.1 AsmA family protein [Thalassobaculum sp. OXR-137]
MRWLHILAGLVGVLAIAVIGLVIFVATLDLNSYKAEIEAAVREATGRDLTIEGDLDLAWTPRPTLTTETVHFANASWGSRPDMATIGRLEVAVDVVPLLSGTLDVQRVALADVDLLLERDATGAANWQLGGDSSGGGAETVPLLRSVDLVDVMVRWKPSPDAETQTVRISRLTLEGEDGNTPLDVSLEADVNGDPIAFDGTLPALSEALRPGATLPVDVTGSVGGRDVALAANLHYAVAKDGALSSIEADRLSLTADGITVTGSASLALDGPRPKLVADLKSDTIALPEGGDGGGDGLEAPLPFDLLTLIDAQVKFSAAEISRNPLILSNLSTTATLTDGTLRLDPLDATVSDGAISAKLMVVASDTVPAQALKATWRGADFGKLAHTLHGSDTLDARGDAAVDLSASGTSIRDMIASLAGTAWITSRDGHIANEDWELIAEDLATNFLPFLEGAGRGTLKCAVGRWTLKRGVAETVVMMVDSDRVTVGGQGTIDLARETLDMRLMPNPKDASLVSLATPVMITGPIANPQIAPDPLAVAKGVGSVVGAAALAGPLALMLPFVSSGSTEPACAEAIAVAQGSKPMPSAGSAGSNEQENKPGGIKGLFDSLRKAVE